MTNRKKLLLLISFVILLIILVSAIISIKLFLNNTEKYSDVKPDNFFSAPQGTNTAILTAKIKNITEDKGIIYADLHSPLWNSQAVKVIVFDPESTLFLRKSTSSDLNSPKYDELPLRIKSSKEGRDNLKSLNDKNVLFSFILMDSDKSDKFLGYVSCNNDLVRKIETKSNEPLTCLPYTKELTVYVKK